MRKPDASPVEYVDVVDRRNRPFAVLPLLEVHRQTLLHRSVLVLVYNLDNKLYLQKRSSSKQLYPGRWDLSATGHVQKGESFEDAAFRELREELGLEPPRLRLKQEVQASAKTGFEFVSLFSAGRLAKTPQPNPNELDGGNFFSRDELRMLLEDYREQMTPGLVYFFERGMLFGPRS